MGNIIRFEDVEDKIVQIKGKDVILDFEVAALYGVQTKEINQSVKNNPRKFPKGYILELDTQESAVLRSKFLTLEQAGGKGKYSKYNFKAFTEKGLYMLATILKGDKATDTTIAIIEAFAKLRELSRTIGAMTKNAYEKRFSFSEEEQVAALRAPHNDRGGKSDVVFISIGKYGNTARE